jgi:hypothetical protein
VVAVVTLDGEELVEREEAVQEVGLGLARQELLPVFLISVEGLVTDLEEVYKVRGYSHKA